MPHIEFESSPILDFSVKDGRRRFDALFYDEPYNKHLFEFIDKWRAEPFFPTGHTPDFGVTANKAVLRPARDRKHQLILRSINVGSLVRHFEEASTDCAACSDNQRYENISHCFYDCPVAQAIWEWFEDDVWKRLFKMIFPISDKYLLITGDHSHITDPNLFGNKTDAAIWAILHSFDINQIYLARCSFHPDISKVENPFVSASGRSPSAAV